MKIYVIYLFVYWLVMDASQEKFKLFKNETFKGI